MADRSNTIHVVNGYDKDAYTFYPVLIVGAGESAIALGCRLKEELGFDQFRMFDRQAGLGGTWWINRYPGVACDVPAVFYSFSFSPNHNWSSFHPPGPEIVRYLQDVCEKYKIVDKIQCNTDVSELRWLEDEEVWEAKLLHMVPGTGDLSTKERKRMMSERGRESVYVKEEIVRAKIVCSAAGGLVEPNSFPDDIPGLDEFEGDIFHSARWNSDVDLRGKDVIVMGTGCSAAQFVPRLTKEPHNAKSVTQIMRSPPWVVPRPEPMFGLMSDEQWHKWTPRLFPWGLGRMYRTLLFSGAEAEFFLIFTGRDSAAKYRKKLEAKLLDHMRATVPEKYHEILTPNYGVGCKRRIFDAHWLKSLNEPDIDLTTKPLTSLQPKGVTLGPGRLYPDPQDASSKATTDEVHLPADAIILANGFELSTWLSPLKIIGKGGAVMQEVWDQRGGAQAYMGNAMDGFPNLFMIFGPNTATGHSSVILASENMVEYSVKFIKKILLGDVKTFEVKKESEIAWTEKMQSALKTTVWHAGGCHSWYKTANGWNSTAYPYSQIDYSIRSPDTPHSKLDNGANSASATKVMMDGIQQLEQTAAGPYFNVANAFPEPSQARSQGNKRKSEDKDNTADGNQGRAKRNRYISIACNECKRRKIRCNGNTPCERCSKLSLDCIFATNGGGPDFKESEEFRAMSNHIHSLQDQVNYLYAGLDALRNGQPFPVANQDQEQYSVHPALAPADPYRNDLPPAQSHGNQPRFQGPTSSAFSFDVARSSLQTMGITAPEVAEGGFSDEDATAGQARAPTAPMTVHPNKDPLFKMTRAEAIRLCHVYEEEMGLMYPMLDPEKIIIQINMLFQFLETAVKSGLIDIHKAGSDRLGNIDPNDVNILRMVLSTALIVEGDGQSDLGKELYESCREAVEGKLSGPVEIKGLILLVLVADYHFQQDEEHQAYRILGLASRQCLEIGLHRRETLLQVAPNDEERSWAVKLFWSIYVLDRRWGFSTGMPFTLQDIDIDPSLPEPDDSSPYLKAMISYSRISSKVWASTNKFDGLDSEVSKDIGYLDHQILQWHQAIPENLKFRPDDFWGPNTASRGQRRLQVILYMRTNQMRVIIYRPVLMSATNIVDNRQYAQTAVDVAKDTIMVLSRLNETTDIYRTQQVCFNYFLTSALAVLFLAVAHAPVEFSRQVQDEFYMALNLVKGFSINSYNSKRLWKAIRGIKEIGPKLGVISRQALTDPNDPHSSAAVAMAGLAGHQVDEIAAFPQYQDSKAAGNSPMNGQQITQELTHLFQKAGGYGNNLFAQSNHPGTDGTNDFVGNQSEHTSTSAGFKGVYGSDSEFSKMMGRLV